MKEIIAQIFQMEISEVTGFFIAAQILGLVNAAVAVISAQFKNLKMLLAAQILMNVIASANYLLLGGNSGAYICALAIVQTSVSFFFSTKKKDVPLAVTLIFLGGYIAVSAIGFKSIFDIIPALAAVAFALSVVQKKPSGYRIFNATNTALWIVYDISVGAYTAIILHGLLITSVFIAIFRYDIMARLRAKKETE